MKTISILENELSRIYNTMNSEYHEPYVKIKLNLIYREISDCIIKSFITNNKIMSLSLYINQHISDLNEIEIPKTYNSIIHLILEDLIKASELDEAFEAASNLSKIKQLIKL